MAKIRGIKPEFWTDEDIVGLSIAARLLFIGMWNFACDNGHLADKPRQIKMRVLPGDDIKVSDLLDELTEAGRITRAEGVITVRNLARHQRTDRRYFTTCALAECEPPEPKTATSQRESRRVPDVSTTSTRRVPNVVTSRPLGDGDGDGDCDCDCDGDGDGDGESEARRVPTSSKPPRSTRGTRIPDGFAVTNDMRQWADEHQFGHLDLDGLTDEFVDFWRGAASNATKSDWTATWRNRIRAVANRPQNGHVTHPEDRKWNF